MCFLIWPTSTSICATEHYVQTQRIFELNVYKGGRENRENMLKGYKIGVDAETVET